MLHYLDDFIMVASNQASAVAQKQMLVSMWERLGVPMEVSKLEGPSQSIKFLGIEFDTVALQLRLPDEKLQRLKAGLTNCIQRDALFKKELENLVGLLQFTTKVVRPGCCFLRCLYSMQNIGSKPNHHVHLNRPAMADIMWWHLFISTWNGISMLWNHAFSQYVSQPQESDASDLTTKSAALAPMSHFQRWDRLRPLCIATKEMIPIVVAAAIFGKQWSQKVVQFHVDNMAVVQVIDATFCSDNL